jgi:alanyl-tRNA synthetase
MQYERGAGGGKEDYPLIGELPKKNIDTGMGLERVAFLMQGVDNLYEIDEVRPVLDLAAQISKKTYGKAVIDDVRLRVVADHVRSALMLIGDGVTPANDGRGYVLRRLLRRVVRSMRLLGVDQPVFKELFTASKNAMVESYPELEQEFTRILTTAVNEEETFLRTLVSGSVVLEEALATTQASGETMLSGEAAFLLHDTYGFPVDLTLEVAEEKGLTIDRDAFKVLMAEQRDRAKADAREKKLGGTDLGVYSQFRSLGVTKFTGYEELEAEAKVIGLIADGVSTSKASAGDVIEVILDTTSLYAESGGQEADSGLIFGDGFELEVLDVQKPVKGLVTHKVHVRNGEVGIGAKATASVDYDWRLGACQAHSATHVVHAALRQVLGSTALQSGSYNKPGYLRLDFSWQQALSLEARSEIEEVSNLAIRGDLAVSAQLMSLPDAKKWGAVALFGETYDELVRVVQIGGPWSRELCGGTHVSRSSQIGLVSLLGDSSVGSGSRRLEALVGIEAFRSLSAERALVSRLVESLKVPREQLEEKISNTVDELKSAQKKLSTANSGRLLELVGPAVSAARNVKSFKVVEIRLGDLDDAADLRTIALEARGRVANEAYLVITTAQSSGKPVIAVAATESARSAGAKAGELVRIASAILGGGGGGKDDYAQGGGIDLAKIDEAIQAIEKAL